MFEILLTVAAAQALAEERRNQSGVSPVPVSSSITVKTSTKPGKIYACSLSL